jgi:ketosteroid isomerase-like protein
MPRTVTTQRHGPAVRPTHGTPMCGQSMDHAGANAATDFRQRVRPSSVRVVDMTTHSTTTDLSVLQGMYAAEIEYLAAGGPGTADFTPLGPFFSPNVVLHQATGLPYGGVWRGHEGMERFFIAMSQTWDVFEMLEQRFLTSSSPLVVLTHVHARARTTGRELDFPILQTITVAHGRITEIRPFYWDTAAIANACAPHPPNGHSHVSLYPAADADLP